MSNSAMLLHATVMSSCLRSMSYILFSDTWRYITDVQDVHFITQIYGISHLNYLIYVRLQQWTNNNKVTTKHENAINPEYTVLFMDLSSYS